MFNPNDKKGTGFTNINRVLAVNKGNTLGATVADGVTKQATNVKTQTQQSQDKFNQEANKNRLDSQENTEKRDGVIGRFNETPNAAGFQASSGLQDKYNTDKTKFQTNLQAQQGKAPVQEQFDQAKYDAIVASGKTNASAQEDARRMLNTWNAQAADRDARYNTQLLGYNTGVSGLQKQMSDLDTQYNRDVEAEREAFLSSQAVNPSESELADFAKFREGKYAGPRELGNFQELLGKADEVEQLGGLTRSTGGRQELLRRFVGGEGYNQGQQRLDNLLLGQSGNQGINEARKNSRGLEKLIVESQKSAGNTAKEFDNRAKAFSEETVNKLNEKRNPINSQIDTQLADIQANETKRGTDYSKLQAILAGSDPESRKLDQAGKTALAMKHMEDTGNMPEHLKTLLQGDKGTLISQAKAFGADPNALLYNRLQSGAGQNINRGGAANAFQETQLNSLDKLLGRSAEFTTPGANYIKGGMGVDTESFQDYLTPFEKAQAEQKQVTEQQAAQKQTATRRISGLI